VIKVRVLVEDNCVLVCGQSMFILTFFVRKEKYHV